MQTVEILFCPGRAQVQVSKKVPGQVSIFRKNSYPMQQETPLQGNRVSSQYYSY